MNLSALFIKRPITTTLITLGIVVFGVMSYRVLPVSDLPAIDFPTISVNASLPGYEETIKPLQTGAAVKVTGQLVDSPGKGQKYEVKAESVHVYGLAPDYPLQKE